jgi:hypothetical protein
MLLAVKLRMARLRSLILGFALVGTAVSAAQADPVTVRYTEGVTRGFPVLRAQSGEVLAQGDLVQVAHANRVENRLVFRFNDGSVYDETLTFTQRGVFTLQKYRIVQRGPSFPESIEATVDRETGEYHVRYRADDASPEEVLTGRFEMPDDAYNGLLGTLLKNLEPGKSQMVHIIAFTPKPRAIKMLLQPMAQEPVSMGRMVVPSTRYHIKPQLGMLASLLVVALPDVKTWIANGEAPAFLKFEGPLFFMGPVWRIDWN